MKSNERERELKKWMLKKEGRYVMRKMRDHWQRSEKSKSGRKKIPEITMVGVKIKKKISTGIGWK